MVLGNGKKKRICVIFTGGTIAMARNPKTGELMQANFVGEITEEVG